EVQRVSSGPEIVRPGQNLNLFCKFTGVSITDNKWIARIYPYNRGKLYSSSLQRRTTIASDNSKNEYSLQLNSMSASDTAIYYCWSSSFWTSGTTKIIILNPRDQ
uniref:Ig-like domain-containing protein n=1 Tax=Laticauda laticaudata TaxID=8630 RepID=A0A8C5SQ06_LATLA